jgi:hypothetical protein
MMPNDSDVADLELAIERMRVATVFRLARRIGYSVTEVDVAGVLRETSDRAAFEALRRSTLSSRPVAWFFWRLAGWRS